MNVDSVISARQPSVSSNDNKRATAAEDISEDSDQNINDPISPGSLENNNDVVSIIIESNFNFLEYFIAKIKNEFQDTLKKKNFY